MSRMPQGAPPRRAPRRKGAPARREGTAARTDGSVDRPVRDSWVSRERPPELHHARPEPGPEAAYALVQPGHHMGRRQIRKVRRFDRFPLLRRQGLQRLADEAALLRELPGLVRRITLF